MTNNHEFTSFELMPKVRIYQGLLPDSDELYRIIKESESNNEGKYFFDKWTQWGLFGTYTKIDWERYFSGEPDAKTKEEKYVYDSVLEANEIAIEDYKKTYNVDLPETSRLDQPKFHKYDIGVDNMDNDLTMQYHTDYIISERDHPGPKFLLTCTTYINDDYEGGEIEFYVGDDFYPYKPKTGDVLVFPSDEPYYHGVKTILKTNKFFTTNFVRYTYNGHPDWLENQRKYGAHHWSKMEIERVDKENPTNMRYANRKPE